ncbi:MAG: hypothetical protein ACK4GE_03015 [Caldimicrobium sp.]
MKRANFLAYFSAFSGLFIGILFFLSYGYLFSKDISKDLPEFKDVKKETETFMRYYYSIKLSPSQQKVLEKALSELKAPCCADFSALTC